MRKQIMDIGFDSLSMEEALDAAMERIAAGERCRVVTPNAEHALMCRRDRRLLEIINSSGLVLPDGISVVLASRIIGDPVRQKLAGVEFADALCGRLAAAGGSLFLFGAKPGVAEQAADKLREKYPGLTVAGCLDGYYDDESKVVEKINAAPADALFVCLGAPKQEYFMAAHERELNVSLMAGLGGTMDVLAGNVRRAPDIFIKLGLEWLYRLLREPRRIGRMAKLPAYLVQAVWFRLRGGGKHA